jgi:hypothetical protein
MTTKMVREARWALWLCPSYCITDAADRILALDDIELLGLRYGTKIDRQAAAHDHGAV